MVEIYWALHKRFGKTAAFLVPIIEQLLQNRKKPYALIIVPTRELATQIEDEFRSMTKGLGLFSACFIGGTNINKDVQNLRRSSHVVIGTQGVYWIWFNGENLTWDSLTHLF